MIQLLEHSSMIWYLIAMAHFRDNNYILCLQSLQNCLSDLKGIVNNIDSVMN